MCICYKFSTKYNKWWTAFFHVQCFCCFLCLIALLFFGRLVFDDLDKKQYIHLGIHIAIFACLLALQTGNRCSIPRLYFVYFIGYHLLLLINVGLEVYIYYTTPHSTNKSLFESNAINETLPTTTQVPLNVIRFPNGQMSPYIEMQENAFYALILVAMLVQTYFTIVVYFSYKYLTEKLTKVHTLGTIHGRQKPSTINTIELGGHDSSNQQGVPANQQNSGRSGRPETTWDHLFYAVRTLASCLLRVVPKQ
ncbi:hypothetical protein M3Y97_00185000 [Aphelenchoides bicaudatus]|nr:hypothetical protein M3Y97_00185000 [Aphelenchoides bicaudatus]